MYKLSHRCKSGPLKKKNWTPTCHKTIIVHLFVLEFTKKNSKAEKKKARKLIVLEANSACVSSCKTRLLATLGYGGSLAEKYSL
jgi:hypothetical protein